MSVGTVSSKLTIPLICRCIRQLKIALHINEQDWFIDKIRQDTPLLIPRGEIQLSHQHKDRSTGKQRKFENK